MHSSNWDDLRYVLAVAEMGSVSAAARALGVNHATVLRRIAGFEEANGAEIFERGPAGYRLRPDMVRMIEVAKQAAHAFDLVERIAQGQPEYETEVMRLTSVDSLCFSLLAQRIAAIEYQIAPARVELVSSNHRLDLSRLEADVTLRPTTTLPEPLVGEVLFDMTFGVYKREGCSEAWLGLSGALGGSVVAQWMTHVISPDRIAARADSFLILREMAAAGQGCAILPRVLGDPDPRLIRKEAGMPDMSIPVWVACHRDLQGVPRIQTLMQAVSAEVTAALAAL